METLCDKCKQEECPRCIEKAEKFENTIEQIKSAFNWLSYGFLFGFVVGIVKGVRLVKPNDDDEEN